MKSFNYNRGIVTSCQKTVTKIIITDLIYQSSSIENNNFVFVCIYNFQNSDANTNYILLFENLLRL